MAKKKLFEYVVLYHEKKDKEIETKIVVDKKTVLARDEATAAMMVAREIPNDLIENLSDCEVIVRPF